MPATITQVSYLVNPLASSSQLAVSASSLDGVPTDLEDAVRFHTAQLMQAAGILLRLPQDLIAQSIVILFRFWTGADGGSLLEYDAQDAAAAAIYLIAKPSAHPVSPRQVLTVFEYLCSLPPSAFYPSSSSSSTSSLPDSDLTTHDWNLPHSLLESRRARLYHIESHILRSLGYTTHVALPHALCINYLQTLGVPISSSSSSSSSNKSPSAVAKRAIAYLNTALLSPQLLYLTHQPSALATAAVYLSARDVGWKLPETEWWEVFDVGREELGFLCVALRSTVVFARRERERDEDGERWKRLWTVKGLREEIALRAA